MKVKKKKKETGKKNKEERRKEQERKNEEEKEEIRSGKMKTWFVTAMHGGGALTHNVTQVCAAVTTPIFSLLKSLSWYAILPNRTSIRFRLAP